MAPIVFVLALLLGSAKGDYPCLCSYQVQTAIYARPDENSNVDGYLLESDCKPFYDLPGIDQKFAAIGIENKPIWIGLHDRTSEEKWQWDSGIPATYFNWMPGRFVDQYHSTEDWVVFVHARHGQWDDMDCDGISYEIVLSFPYICQFRL